MREYQIAWQDSDLEFESQTLDDFKLANKSHFHNTRAILEGGEKRAVVFLSNTDNIDTFSSGLSSLETGQKVRYTYCRVMCNRRDRSVMQKKRREEKKS